MNPDLTELARLRTMNTLWAFVGQDFPDAADAARLAELEGIYPSVRTRPSAR
jgi:hypothetical protein